jgi:hypothetical protein
VHPWGKPSQEKNPGRPERCSVDGAVASFHDLQVKLCTISTQRFCLVVSASETNCRSPVVFRAAAEAAKKKRVSGQYATAEIGHAASELQKGQRAIWGPCVEIRAVLLIICMAGYRGDCCNTPEITASVLNWVSGMVTSPRSTLHSVPQLEFLDF